MSAVKANLAKHLVDIAFPRLVQVTSNTNERLQR